MYFTNYDIKIKHVKQALKLKKKLVAFSYPTLLISRLKAKH